MPHSIQRTKQMCRTGLFENVGAVRTKQMCRTGLFENVGTVTTINIIQPIFIFNVIRD